MPGSGGPEAAPRRSPGGPDEGRLLAALLSSPSTVLVGADLDGRVDLWSLGAQRLYGWREEEVLGRPLALLLPPGQDSPRTPLVAGEQMPPFETTRLAKDGSAVPVELHVVVVQAPDGAPVGTVALHRDLRRQKQAERLLDVSQDEVRARFVDSPVAQSRVNVSGRILAVNPALEAMMGVPADQLVGRSGLDLYVPEDQDDLQEALAQLGAGAVSYVQTERTLLRTDGRHVRVEVTVAGMRDQDDQLVLAGSAVDVTALRAAEQRLRAEASRFEAMASSMPVAVFSYDADGVCTSSRGQALARFGLCDNELVGVSLLELYADEPPILHLFQECLAGRGMSAGLEAVERAWDVHHRPLYDDAGALVGGIGIAVDVTDRTTAEHEVAVNEARLQSLLQHASEVAFVMDVQGRVSFVSAAVKGQLGYEPADLPGQDANRYNHPDDRHVMAAGWRAVLQAPGATVRLECRVLHADGTWRWADHVLTNLLDDPAVAGIVINVKETTERRRAEEELRRLAVRDGLTGLANRTLLLDRVEQALVAGRRSGAATGLMLLDVVAMTTVNERLGQAGGDHVLRVVAQRLQAAALPSDTVARVAGAGFAVLAVAVASEEELRARTTALLEVMDEAVLVDDEPVQVRLRAGTALSPAVDAGALLAAAEHAVVLTGHVSRLVVTSPGSEDGALAEDALRRAIREGELVLHFQPVVRLADDVVLGAEALVRWQHPERGLLLPGEFIPLAERSGLVMELGAWVLREACTRLATWATAGRHLSVGINLSPRQLVGSDFLDLVREVLAAHGVPAQRLVLEVTESAFMDDPGAPGVLRALHDLGLHLALDDFGTGYSSLTYLKRFPVDAIKIDRSFVSGLGRDRDDEAIVASVVSLGRAVGKLVIAEGVETVDQLQALRLLGVDQGQGFLWSRALSAEDFTDWLDAPRTTSAGPRPPVATALPATATATATGPAPAPATAAAADEERIRELHGMGASLHTVAAALNVDGRRTGTGARWTTRTVARVIAGLECAV